MLPSSLVLDRPVSGGVGWAVVQLADPAALVPVTTIERDLLRHVPAVEVFFPAITVEGLPSPLHPLANYAFPRAALPDQTLLTLERSRFVEAVLRDGPRRVAKISDADLTWTLRAKLKEAKLRVGQVVTVLSGDWAGLQGKVANLKHGVVTVLLELHSTRTLIHATMHEIEPL